MCLFGLARWNQLCITKYLCYTINKACVLGARKCLRLFISSTQRNRARCSIPNYLARPMKFTMCHSSISADWLAFVYRFIDFSLNVVVSIKKKFRFHSFRHTFELVSCLFFLRCYFVPIQLHMELIYGHSDIMPDKVTSTFSVFVLLYLHWLVLLLVYLVNRSIYHATLLSLS